MIRKMILIVFYFIVINVVIKGDDLEKKENKSLIRIVLKEDDRKSNWFLNVGTGASIYLNNNGFSTPLRKRTTLNYNFVGGKWISPILGLRLAVAGGKIHTSSINDLDAMNSITYFNAHSDLLFNLSNYILQSVDRKYSFMPNIGIGYIRGDNEANLFKTNGFNGPTVNTGLLNTYQFSDRISVYVELNASLVESKFDRQDWQNDKKNHWSGIVSLNTGISINLGKTGLKKVLLQDMSELDILNNIINVLREDTYRRICHYPIPCPSQPDCPPPVNIHQDRCMAGNVVFFPINSFELHNSQLITLYNYSEFLKSNLKSKMKLIGYADKETGSDAYNLKLSKKRAENVANVLVNKYGIERDRLIVESKGSSEQPYKDNKWNRAVVLLVDDE